jgi:hypothetical protein
MDMKLPNECSREISMKDQIQLDYQFWSKLDNWSYRDAALLLCGFDPDQAKGLGIRLDGRNHPVKYAEASKVYRILKSAPDLGHNQAHPFAIIEFALKKSLPMPKALFETIRERYCLECTFDGRDTNDNLCKQDEDTPGSGHESDTHPRTKKFLLRLIYVMASRGYGFKLTSRTTKPRRLPRMLSAWGWYWTKALWPATSGKRVVWLNLGPSQIETHLTSPHGATRHHTPYP